MESGEEDEDEEDEEGEAVDTGSIPGNWKVEKKAKIKEIVKIELGTNYIFCFSQKCSNYLFYFMGTFTVPIQTTKYN